MKYNFDKVINRKGTASYKWDGTKFIFGTEDILPMWVADMDFPTAEPIIEAVKKRLEHKIFGYTFEWDSLRESVVERLRKKYNWQIKPEWIVFTPGVVSAVSTAIKSITHPGDEVILQGPVYYPFYSAIKNNGCAISNNRLKFKDSHYKMDFDDLQKRFDPHNDMRHTPSRVKAAILCSPHNPTGRIWKKDELKKFGEIVVKNNAVVISDEIHCEIVYKNNQHIPFATISEEFEQNSITCMAPSKTFNLAGLVASSIIIPNDNLRKKFIETTGDEIMGDVNVLGLVAMEAAYRHGDEWLEQVLKYLQENLEFLKEFVKEKIPEIKLIEPEGTYLAWLDFRSLGMNAEELSWFLRNRARVGLDDGYLFGPSGTGFERLNFACPRSILKEGLVRIERAIKNL
jgi:cystathionine beta-lyase